MEYLLQPRASRSAKRVYIISRQAQLQRNSMWNAIAMQGNMHRANV